MDFVIYETDERMFLLKNELEGITPPVRTHIFAPNIVLDEKNTIDINGGEYVVYGKSKPETAEFLSNKGVKMFNIAKNEDFQAVNSRLTAFGALKTMLSHANSAPDDLDILIIGFGRTGCALARLLDAIGVKSLTISTNSSLRQAKAFANDVIESSNFDFSKYDVIFNTAPEKIVTDKEILSFKPTAIYIDLASTPALSLCFAKYIGIDADIYPALPAKVCPKSAAKAIADYIKKEVII
ncbi:MAG: hypothetical protein MJ193_00195 [Clostridia bacterium]|nr:hypothetical protein [Clostridia bacterium]